MSSLQRGGLWKILYMVGIAVLVTMYALIWLPVMQNHSSLGNTDFLSFYAVGRIAQQAGFSHVYEADLQQQVEEQTLGQKLEAGRSLLYIHVPYVVLPLSVLVGENYLASYLKWVVLLVLVYGAGMFLFVRTVYGDSRFLLTAGSLVFFPLFISLLQGQDTAFLLLGASLWCVGMLKGNDWLSGAGLALLSVRPHICLMLAIPILFRYRTIIWKFLFSGFVLGIVSLLAFGVRGMTGFINMLSLSARGGWFGMDETRMLNLIGLLQRLFPSLDPSLARIVGWLGLALGTMFLFLLWQRIQRTDSSLLGFSLLLALFLAPHLYYHDLALLSLPLLFAIQPVLSKNKGWGMALLLLVSILLLISFINETVYLAMPYLLFAALGWMLVRNRWTGQSLAHEVAG